MIGIYPIWRIDYFQMIMTFDTAVSGKDDWDSVALFEAGICIYTYSGANARKLVIMSPT